VALGVTPTIGRHGHYSTLAVRIIPEVIHHRRLRNTKIFGYLAEGPTLNAALPRHDRLFGRARAMSGPCHRRPLPYREQLAERGRPETRKLVLHHALEVGIRSECVRQPRLCPRTMWNCARASSTRGGSSRRSNPIWKSPGSLKTSTLVELAMLRSTRRASCLTNSSVCSR